MGLILQGTLSTKAAGLMKSTTSSWKVSNLLEKTGEKLKIISDHALVHKSDLMLRNTSTDFKGI